MKTLNIFAALFIACSAASAQSVPPVQLLPATPKSNTERVAACYAISNGDQRAWCLAAARGNPSQCDAILDMNTRAMCRAATKQ